ncbi:lipase family alpha/beta hydrolase [Aquirhabdus parva]|uniref:Triacylglycerol lipase n=1 Tax=Aquirhabdus parva TaxID=2283318 RepID=A0A345P3R6_9GAMM|nr:triacylglycerol lipase [Aquirhabdus parva]AXI01925.1 triacylglycerol lipase [Aquirhabdus parva]
MKNRILTPLLLTGGLLISGWASATVATYQFCSTDGCRTGGSATVTSDYAKTKYPIVFAHGMAGFSSAGPLQYWYGISPDLVANGANVFVTQEASFNSSEVRGEQLLNQVQQILAITGAAKVNLIGHSHGSHSIRYVAGLIPNQVASATAVGGPNKGSPVADVIYNLSKIPVVGSTILAPVISAGVNAFFSLVGISSGHYYDQDSLAGLNSLTTAGSAAFTANFPAGMPTSSCGEGAYVANGVRYYSWGGTSKLTNVLDPLDAALVLTGALIPGDSDGLVPRCSSHLGQVIRDNYAQNHLDEVNQTLGLVNIFAGSPVTLYRQQANRLKVAGL